MSLHDLHPFQLFLVGLQDKYEWISSICRQESLKVGYLDAENQSWLVIHFAIAEKQANCRHSPCGKTHSAAAAAEKCVDSLMLQGISQQSDHSPIS